MTTPARLRLHVLAVLVALVSSLSLAHAQQPPILIKDLAVEGNRRVQEAVILGRVKSAVGSTFNPSLLAEDLRSIFGLGFFDDVQMRVEDFEGGVKVTFLVSERPFIRDVDFTGNKKVASNTLQEKIDLKLGSVYNPVEVQRAREKLQEYYEDEGYFEVQITPTTEKFADGDVRVTFAINEGRRITIDRIVVRGNTGLTDRQIKRVMATQERQYFILRGTVQRQRLDDDVERILALYNDFGYIQARVESTDVSIDRDTARVTITVSVIEGPQYRVGDVKIIGVTLLPESEVLRQMRLKSGDVFSRSALRDSVRSIVDLYSTIGRASADVAPRSDNVPGERINLTLEVSEGPEVYVERINIAGNVRSQDRILRREIPMVEGDLFTLQKMNQARQRLVNLGYFEKVDVTTQPGSDKTKIIVNVDVTERPTGMFSIGGGYSSVNSFVGTINLSQRNFLGRGWQVDVRIAAGAIVQQGSISFTEPWLFDRPLSAGFDIFSTRRIFDEYDYDSIGGDIRFSHPFLDYWRWNAGYRLSQDEILRVRTELTAALRDQVGAKITSMVTGGVTRDSRDNVVTPSKGGLTSVLVEVAGLGGDWHFAKAIASSTYFKPVWFDHILSGRVEGAYGFGFGREDLPLFERFYLGGPNTIRSFKFRKISPVDENGLAIGGTTEILGNIEYLVPLPFNLRLAGFYDVGNVYGFSTKFDITDLKQGVGAGVRWLSPFGPIRVDYGINPNPKRGEDFGAFQFSVGSTF